MTNEMIMIFSDSTDEDNTLIDKINSWGYRTCSFPIKSPNIPDNPHNKPDLILMDLTPNDELTGVDLALKVVNDFDAPLIYLVNECDNRSIELARSTAPYIHIDKPFNNKELKIAIKMVISRHRSDRKLKEDVDNFRLLYERAPIAYQSLNNDGYLVEVNETWLDKMGYSRQDVIGKWFGDFLAPECVELFRENFPKFKAQGEIFDVLFHMIRDDGARIEVSFDGKIGYDKHGNFRQTHCIFQDITEQKKAQTALKESEQYYKTIFENTGTATIIVEADSTISLVNTEFEKLYGRSKDDIVGKRKWHDFVSQDFLPMMKEYHATRRINPNAVPRNYEFDFIDAEGKLKNIFTTIAIIPGTGKSLVSLQDITDGKEGEKKLKTSLNEKDMLLREIHHRVKNNLQIISSLLNLQSRYIEDEDALDVFTESQNRVRSMAIIHEKLYNSKSMSNINFGEYITDLTDSLFYNYRVDPNRIMLNKNMDKIFFDVDTAIPLGLIINELITNCLKHAFPGDNKGMINIDLVKDGSFYKLNISDDGVGFPDNVDYKNTKSLGLQLVNNLVNQIDGKLELDGNNGTTFKIIFKELQYKNRV
jgi:PAS domain S-box-containing protein